MAWVAVINYIFNIDIYPQPSYIVSGERLHFNYARAELVNLICDNREHSFATLSLFWWAQIGKYGASFGTLFTPICTVWTTLKKIGSGCEHEC